MSELYIYAIYCPLSNRVKIGHSSNPLERIETIQIHSPTELELLGYIEFRAAKKIAEPVLHKMLAASRLHGEWFDCSNPLVKQIADTLRTNDKDLLTKIINNYQYGIG